MNKTFLTLVCILIAILGIGLYVLFQGGEDEDLSGSGGAFAEFPVITGEQNGTAVQLDVANFEEINEGEYLVSSVQNQNKTFYEIYYYPETGLIGVSLLSPPISVARELAQENLVKLLEVSEDSLCSMPISINTPRFASPKYAGRELGVSYCPGSEPLE